MLVSILSSGNLAAGILGMSRIHEETHGKKYQIC